MDVVRCELEIPFELAGLRFERQDRVGVEIVALAIVAVVIETGIAGRPVHEIELRIVRARHPGGAAAMLRLLALPGFGTGLTRRSARSRSARLPCPVVGVVRRDESAHTFVATGGSGDHQIADDERRGCPVVVLVPVRHFGFPQQLAVERSSAIMWALSVSMNTRSPETATPRLNPPAALPAMPVRSRHADSARSARPVPASSA